MQEAAERARLAALRQAQQIREQQLRAQQEAAAAAQAKPPAPQPTTTVVTPGHAEGYDEQRKTPKVYTGPKVTMVIPPVKVITPPQVALHEQWQMQNPEIKLPETGAGQPDIRPLYVSMLKAFDHAADEWKKRAQKSEGIVVASPTFNDIKDDVKITLPSTYKVASKDIPAVLMHAATQAILGGIEEVTFPAAWGVVPPKTGEDRLLRIAGGLLTPSPIDYAATQLIRKLALRKNGAKLINDLFIKEVPLETRLTWQTSITELIESEKLGQISIHELRAAGRALGGSADELIENANRIDDTLTSLTGKENWAGKVNLVPSPKNQRDAFNELQIQMRELMKAIDDLAPIKGGKVTKFGQLSLEEQRKFAKVFNEELIAYWEAHPDYFTAGAAHTPPLIHDVEDMLNSLEGETDDYVDFLAQNGKGNLPVGIITQILNDLNTPTSEAASAVDMENYVDRPDLYQLQRPFSEEKTDEELIPALDQQEDTEQVRA